MINDLNQTYNKHFDYDYERGMVGENYLKEYVHGTHEVKTEYLTIKTGNFYIETFQYNINGEWPSGINVTTATHWVFASTTGNGGISIKVSFLKHILANENLRDATQPTHNEHTNASKGKLLPLTTLLRYLSYQS